MSGERCDGCGRRVSVAGGIANVWSFGGRRTSGMTLELADGSEHFLCFDCVNDLPDEPTEADVVALPERDRDEPIRDGAPEAGGVGHVGAGILLGGAAGAVVAVALGERVEPWAATGAALGVGLALLAGKLGGG